MTVSLRTRLLSGVLLGMAVLLTLFCITIYSLTGRTVVRNFDDSLLASARLLSAFIEDKGFVPQKESDEDAPDASEEESAQESNDESVEESDEPSSDEMNEESSEDSSEEDSDEEHLERDLELEFNIRMTPEFANLYGGAYYQFWTQDRDKTIRSPSLGQEDLRDFEDESDNPFYGECSLPRGKPGRAIRIRFIPRSDDDNSAVENTLTLVVARESTELVHFLLIFRWLLIGSSAGIVLLSTGVAMVVSGAGLRPIHALAGTIRTVNEQTLEQSFATEAYPVELHPICDCLNALLQRIRFSFERERRFNADVAHELRTPLAGIQTTLEVTLARRRDPEEYQQALRDCLAIARSMQKMVDTLLSLSRLDAQKLTIRRQTIPLRPLVESRWRVFADKAFDRGLTFENRVAEGVACVSDADHLSMIFSNIFDNAVDYTDKGGRIWVGAESAGDSTVLSISNTGCTLAPESAERVFDAFWRQDASRTGTGNHCGIGLAVVRKIADALGISVSAKVEPGGIFIIVLGFSSISPSPSA
jgi:two-component system, OmpR family, heavy metal sensor histidine kinase CusS